MVGSLRRIVAPAVASVLGILGVSAAGPPNIVVILADDLGIMDINAYAEAFTGTPAVEQYYETPNLDRLVARGTAFRHAYAAQLCSPTRASILTGLNPARLGFTTATPGRVETYYNQNQAPPPGRRTHDAIYWGDNISLPQAWINGSSQTALPSGNAADGHDVLTLAEALPDHESYFIGKWHLGGHGATEHGPAAHGFTTLDWLDAGGSPYFNWSRAWNRTRLIHPDMPQAALEIGHASAELPAEELTESMGIQAARFLESRGGDPDPFFLYLCHFAVHTPLQSDQDLINYYAAKSTRGWNNHDHAIYAAMLHKLDQSVGLLLDTLESTGLAENTIVIFLSDNGGIDWKTRKPNSQRPTDNAPFKGGKAMLFEGGVRVPLMISWPGQLPAREWSNQRVHCADLMPTLLELAGVEIPVNLDGISLTDTMRSPRRANIEPRTFYWHYPFNVAPLHPDDGFELTPHSAILDGNWKLIHDWHGRLYLHDLANDPFERTNLAPAQPGRTQALFAKLHDWLDTNVAPHYFPMPNPGYDPATEVRDTPFRDYREDWR